MTRRFAFLLGLCLAVAACGGSDEPAATSTTTSAGAPTTSTADAESTTTAGVAAGSETTTTTAVSLASSSLRDLRADLGIASIALQPADEGGPHPTLAWDPVDGAAAYWLVLRDGSGDIYWAWTGAATSVRVGGGDRPDLNQTAALHEPMTWSVTAIDDSGTVVAFSDTATVSP